MARRVFFSFHHQYDSWRAGQVRNSWVGKGENNTFVDGAAWEEVKKKGDVAVKAWIDGELKDTSVTVVLIGKHTATRRWVKYEISESYKRGNGLLGIYIHGIKDQNLKSSWWPGRNPLSDVEVEITQSFFGLFNYRTMERLSDLFPTYYWYDDDGRANLPKWIEAAAVPVRR